MGRHESSRTQDLRDVPLEKVSVSRFDNFDTTSCGAKRQLRFQGWFARPLPIRWSVPRHRRPKIDLRLQVVI